jgi:hypothetical protein
MEMEVDNTLARWLFGGLAIVMLAVPIVTAPSACNAYEKDQESRSWPSTSGRIISSRMMSGPPDAEWSDVEYEYRVDGRRYTSDRVSFGGPLHLSVNVGPEEVCCESAEDIVRRHPAGRTVRVHYDPKDPREAVLQPGRGPSILLEQLGAVLIGVVVGGGFLAVAVFGRDDE